MSVTIDYFPGHPADRQYCIVWTRKDGAKIRGHCSTEEDCKRLLPEYEARAERADKNGWENL